MAVTSELLTAREVQDALKIDRTTVYRMLKDGRLEGVKVGQQWRFARDRVEALLAGTAPDGAPAAAHSLLPLHCVQSIQDMFAELTGVAALVTAPGGAPLTRPSGGAAPGGACVSAPIVIGGRTAALFVAGPAPDAARQERLAAWAHAAARTLTTIGEERAAVAVRLRQIAALTEMNGA